jgi:hypothetical protein
MKTEYDFSGGERGKFYQSDATFSFPIYLESDLGDFLNKLAEEKNIDVQVLVNEFLRNNLELLKSTKYS